MSLFFVEYKEFYCGWRLEFKRGMVINEIENQDYEVILY